MTSLERLRGCGHTAVDGAGVTIRCTGEGDARRAGFAGLATCGSVWACPVCAARIAADRAAELGAVLAAADDAGLRIALVTLTVQHHQGDSLREVWGAVTKGWGRVTSGKGWKTDSQRHGIAGWARAVEVTHGHHGWHVHVHAVVAYRGAEADAHTLGASMWSRWHAGITRAGFSAIAGSGGLDVRVSQGGDLGALGRYLAKQGADLEGLAAEATMGAFKQAKGQNRTPFQIARAFLTTGDMTDLALWHEWEKVSKGRRQLTWSKGMRELAELGAERSDEDIAAEEIGSSADDVLLLPGETWREVRREATRLLDLVETGGRAALVAHLDTLGLAWLDPPERTPAPG